MGLALVKRIVELHGGRVWIEPGEDGRGTTVCFTLAGAPAELGAGGAARTAPDADMAATHDPAARRGADCARCGATGPSSAARRPADKGAPAYYSGTYYYLKPEGVSQLEEGLKRTREIAEKAQFPRTSSWFQLVNGGEGPAFYQSQPRWTWADFEAPDADARLRGRRGARQVAGRRPAPLDVVGSVRYTVTEMTKARPELGYEPAKK